jgi:hypothetical protein
MANELENYESSNEAGVFDKTSESLSDKLSFIETSIQTILTSYKLTKTTSLSKVAVVDTNSSVKKYSDYLESEQITVVYRELPGFYPNMPVADKIVTASFFVYALEKEKYVVKKIIDEFTDTYNTTLQELTSGDFKFQFTNLTPIGRADNKGALIYQTWQFGATITVIDSVTSIFNRSVTIGSYTLNATKGLVSAQLEKAPVYAEYAQDTSKKQLILRYMHYRLTFSVLDSDDSDAAYVKGLVYDSTEGFEVTYTSGTEDITFDAKIISAIDSVSEQGYPIINFTLERG